MSRLIFPTDFNKQVDLLAAVDAKNTAEGAASVLQPYLLQHNIDLTAFVNIAVKAKTHDSNHVIYVKQANNYRQLRDMKFEPVFADLKKEVQFLKSLFGSNFTELGTWGITIDAKGKITYPASFAGRKQLFDVFYKKYSGYPAGQSPVEVFLTQHNISMADDNTAVQYAEGCEVSCTKTIRLAENETQMRDLIWLPVAKSLRAIGDFLKNLYVTNDRQLGLWGFVVDNSIQKPRVSTKKLKLGQQKTVTSIVLGTTLHNIGTVDIVLHKGKTTNGNPVLLKPGEKMGIQRGWSTTTIINASTLETAVFQVTVNK